MSVGSFSNVLSPKRETLSYETLWAAPNMTLKWIASLYEKHRGLPSRILDAARTEVIADFDNLSFEVARFMDQLAGRFSVGVNGAFQYPTRLRDAKYPLELFYYRGDIGLMDSPCVSIVGSRSCSVAGQKRAARLARELVDRDITIVSGLAAGIDTAAMESAIAAKGRTIGVIGTPLNQSYPRENADLQELVATEHLLVSQVPFWRYANEPFKNRKFYFPQRNETMAALSAATIIVEASETSGTHTQARACMQQKRKLFILNSCFESGLKWPFTYEKQGAIRVRELSDILEAIGPPASDDGNGESLDAV